jgi:serine/threonine protein kinase
MNRIGHPVTEDEVALIIPQLLDALKSIHNGGICHLDLQPSNIMIDKAKRIKLIDFGLKISIDQMLEDKGIVIGAVYTTIPSYYPPELLGRHYQRIGPWTDFYLLGATLYNLLTNEHPPHFGD